MLGARDAFFSAQSNRPEANHRSQYLLLHCRQYLQKMEHQLLSISIAQEPRKLEAKIQNILKSYIETLNHYIFYEESEAELGKSKNIL